MKKSISYTIGNTCKTCGNEFERVTLKLIKKVGKGKEHKTAHIPYCKQCKIVKHGLGEDIDTIKTQTIQKNVLYGVLKFLPIILGICGLLIYNDYFYVESDNQYISFGILFGIVIITSIVLNKLGLMKKTVDVSDLKKYYLDEYENVLDIEPVLESITSKFHGNIIRAHNSHFDRYDLFETYLRHKDTEDRIFYVIESERVHDDNLLTLKYTKNRFFMPNIHILFFDSYKNTLHVKHSESDFIEEDLGVRIERYLALEE